MNKPTISIIIPFYNTKWFMVEKCLHSILQQKMTDYEVIIINDGSKDMESLSKCEEFVSDKEKFTLLHNDGNRGVSYSRNSGIEHANGQYILFVDADDWVEPSMFEELVKASENGAKDTVFFDYCRSDGETVTPDFRKIECDCSILNIEMINRMLLSNDFNSPCTIMYSREILMQHHIRFKEGIKMGEDFLFNVEYLMEYKNGAYVRKGLYYYRYNSNSATNTFSFKHVEDTGRGYICRKELMKQYYPKGCPLEIQYEFNNMYTKHLRAYLLNAINSNATKADLEKCIQLEWAQDVLNSQVTGLSTKFVQAVIKHKCFIVLRVLARVKRILNR